jgi:hypothetical protein
MTSAIGRRKNLLPEEIVVIKDQCLKVRITGSDIAPNKQQLGPNIPIGDFEGSCEVEFVDIILPFLKRAQNIGN